MIISPRAIARDVPSASSVPTMLQARATFGAPTRLTNPVMSGQSRGTLRAVAGPPPAVTTAATEPTLKVPFASLINRAAARHGVDPTLVAAVTKAESGFDPKAVSRSGAKGLMQLMDKTAKSLGVHDSFDPEQNIDGGTKFLGELMQRFRTPELALAAYNAGPAAVARTGGIPQNNETPIFVARVLEFQRALQGSK
jgi:soluble lytic murein transglycosylase-like protein